MAKEKLEGLKDDNVLARIMGDFEYSRDAKEAPTVFLDAHNTITKRNHASQTALKIMHMFYVGDQWTYDKDGTPIARSKHITFPTVNFIRTIVDQRVDMFRKRKITIDAKPVGEEDTTLALAVQYLLKHFWKKHWVSLKLAEAYQDALVYMAGFFKLIWNDNTEDLDVVVISPFDVYPDPYGTELDNMRYIHIVYKKPAEYIEKKYGVRIEKKEKENKNKKTQEGDYDPNEEIQIVESWYSPSVFGEAYCIIWTEGQILSVKKVKDITGSNNFPIFAFKVKRSSNSFWGQSLVYNLIDIQLLHNKSLGFILDSMILSNNGRIVTSDPNIQITDDPTQVITISDADELIQTLNLAGVDPRWFSIVQYSGYNLAQNLTGTYAVNMGGGTNTQTATGIVAIQNAGNTGVEADIFELTSELNRFGEVLLGMIQRLYSKEQILDIIGEYSVVKKEKDSIVEKMKNVKFDLFFDLSDPLPDDKLSRNNFFAGLMMQKQIDLGTYAKMTGNVELLNILKEQQEQAQPMQQMMQALAGQGEAPQGEGVELPQSDEEKFKEKTDQMLERAKEKAGVGI